VITTRQFHGRLRDEVISKADTELTEFEIQQERPRRLHPRHRRAEGDLPQWACSGFADDKYGKLLADLYDGEGDGNRFIQEQLSFDSESVERQVESGVLPAAWGI
jgi:hypothetical protein